jgi:hypothetical protein
MLYNSSRESFFLVCATLVCVIGLAIVLRFSGVNNGVGVYIEGREVLRFFLFTLLRSTFWAYILLGSFNGYLFGLDVSILEVS